MAYKNYNRSKDKLPWMGQRVTKGKRIRKAFATKKEALAWEATTENPQVVSSAAQKTPSVSLIEWATKYLEYAQNKFVHNTFDEKRRAFRLLLNYDEIDPSGSVDALEPLIVLEHLQKQAERRSGNSANKDRKNLLAAWNWGVKFMQFPRENPFLAVEKFASDRHSRPVPTLEEFWQIYDEAETEQDKLMLFAYLQTGARRDELFRLRWVDVDFFGKRVQLFSRKNKAGEWKGCWISVRQELLDLLLKHKKATKQKNLVFGYQEGDQFVPYLYRQHWLKRLCKKAGVPEFGFHGIRHLFASILAAQNVPLVEIQYMLRHDCLTTTQKYIHRLKKENREVLAALPGLRSRNEKSPPKVHQDIVHPVSQAAK